MMTLLAFVVAVVLLVMFHEYGHYWVARRCGVKVLVFSLGFGKVLYRKRFANSETEWVISAIPLGGYVKMLDEREGEVAPSELHRAFNRKPVLQRMAIVVAGPLANFILAILLYWVLFMHGIEGLKPVLGDVPAGTPAAVAQMHKGETILSVDDVAIPSWQELRWTLMTLALKRVKGRQDVVEVEATDGGVTVRHRLDISGILISDLQGEFLEKLGLHTEQPEIAPVIGMLTEKGVAKQAGFEVGDLILRADGLPVQSWGQLVELVRTHPKRALRMDIQRGQRALSLEVTPEAVAESGGTIGRIGAAPKFDQKAWQSMTTTVRYGPMDALGESVVKTWQTSAISLKMLAKMVVGEVSVKNLSGPVTIADYAGQSAHMGLIAYLGFLALISISLGVLNLLPVPLLDGGHLLYYVAESIKGSPVSEQAWENGQRVGIALLGTLMVLAFYNDINRLISG
jgi:regulator of sigma E protease